MTLKKFVQGRIILIAGSMNELKLIFFMYINHDDEVFVQELTSYFLNELPTYIPKYFSLEVVSILSVSNNLLIFTYDRDRYEYEIFFQKSSNFIIFLHMSMTDMTYTFKKVKIFIYFLHTL